MKRRKYLINSRYQIGYSLLLSLSSAVIAAILGMILVSEAEQNSESLQKVLELEQERTSLMLLLPDLTEEHKKQLVKNDQALENDLENPIQFRSTVKYYMFFFTLIIGITLFMLGVYVTHRVAGPVFVIQRYLKQILKNERPKLRVLRKKDHFQDLFLIFSQVVDKLTKKGMFDDK